MTDDNHTSVSGVVYRVCLVWALLGGAILTAVIGVNVMNVVGGIFGTPFPGDYELTEIGVAVAVFMFLPYCQITQANVTADIFSMRASKMWLSLFAVLGSCAALGVSLLLLWRMQAGLVDQKTYGYFTTILQLPIWWAFIPILISLALLVLASLVTLLRAVRSLKGQG